MTNGRFMCIITPVAERYSDGVERKVSSAGRALALQARGHRFEPCTFHQFTWPGGAVG